LALTVLIGVPHCLGAAEQSGWLRNSSFEVGTYGWTWFTHGRFEYPDEVVRPTVDRSAPTAAPALGTASLKLFIPPHMRGFQVESGIVPVKGDSQYTLSFYVRADRATRISAVCTDGYKIYARILQKPAAVSTEWRRHAFAFKTLCPFLRVRLEVWGCVGRTFWVDGLQLEPGGEATAYRPWRGIDIGPVDAQPHHLYHVGDQVSPRFLIHQYGSQPNAYTTSYRTEEALTGRVVGEASVAACFARGEHLIDQRPSYVLPSDRRGVFKTTVRVLDESGEERNFCEHIYGVFVPIPAPGEYTDSMFAMDHHLDMASPGGRDSFDAYFKMASDIGVCCFRDEWPRFRRVMPEEGKFVFDDSLLKLAEKHKMRTMLTLGCEDGHGYIPEWARDPKHDKQWYRGIRVDAWRSFCASMIKHFHGRVKYWEVLNERFAHPQYPELLRIAYEEIKKADRTALVFPNLMWHELDVRHDLRRLRDRYAETGEHRFFDLISLHMYQAPQGNTPPDLCIPSYEESFAGLRKVMRQFGGEKPIWMTEGGFTWDSYYSHMAPLPACDVWHQRGWWRHAIAAPDKRGQQALAAAYCARKYVIFAYLRCAKFFYFVFNHLGVLGCYDSLLEFDDTPKLPYISHAQSVRMLHGAEPMRKLSLGEKVRGYAFRHADGRTCVALWNVDDRDAELTVRLPAKELEVEDVLGNPIAPKAEGAKTILPCGAAPTYVRTRLPVDSTLKAFEAGSAAGLIPFEMGIALARDPSSGRPAAAVVVRNVGVGRLHTDFQILGFPPEWSPERDAVSVGPLEPKQASVAYLPFTQVTAQTEPVVLKVAKVIGDEMLQSSRTLPRVVLCPRRTRDIRIDGRLAALEWRGAPELRLQRRGQVMLFGGVKEWPGPDAFSGTVAVSWDSSMLYLGARVKTHHFIQNKTDARVIFNSTCIEVYLSLKPETNVWNFLYQPSDYHLLFAPATVANSKYYQRAVRQTDNPVPLSGVQMAARPVAGGYEMEIGVPWPNFEELRKPEPGSVIGFDVGIDGTGADGERRFQMNWCGDGQNCARVDKFAIFVLVEK